MGKVVNKTVNVYGKQQKFLQSPCAWRAFCGGIGSGKSFIGALDMIRRAKPGRLYLVTAPTYPMLSDASFRSFVDVAMMIGCVNPSDIKRSPPPSIKLVNGSEVLFRSTDNPDMLRGPNLSGVWMDEASLSKKEAFDILVGRLREGGDQGWGTATFTPKGKLHWTYKVFGSGQQDTELIRATSSENPFLPKGFVEGVRKRYTTQQADQELGGAFIGDGGNHYRPREWPRYQDWGDAYRIADGVGRWRHIKKDECTRILTLDWAMGKPKKDSGGMIDPEAITGDCTAFVVADMSTDGRLFHLWSLNERIASSSRAPRLAEACVRWRPMVVCSDDDNMSETMLLETKRYRDIPTVRCLPTGGKNKLARSTAAIIRAERGMMYMPENELANASWFELFCDNLSSFTGADGEPDDLADCESLLGRLVDEYVPSEDGEPADPDVIEYGYSNNDVFGSEGINMYGGW